MTDQPTVRPRDMLYIIRARYDCSAVPQGIWVVIKELEAFESWRNHVDWVRRAAGPLSRPPNPQTDIPTA